MDITPPKTHAEVKPILRWAGSKRKLLPYIASHFPKQFERYVEPFAGSACVFVKLDPARAILSDINSELIRAYKVIRRSPEAISDVLAEFPKSDHLYYLLRYVHPTDLDDISRAARFIYLNRFSFNGVYRTNGEGRYNVPMGTKTGPLPTRDELRQFSTRLRRTQLKCKDFEEIVAQGKHGDFYYLDPPYSEPGTRFRGEYGWGSFSAEDEDRLISALNGATGRGVKVLLSYNSTITARLPNWEIQRVGLMRSVGGFGTARKAVTEVLMRNY